jgi:hypothetical protein
VFVNLAKINKNSDDLLYRHLGDPVFASRICFYIFLNSTQRKYFPQDNYFDVDNYIYQFKRQMWRLFLQLALHNVEMDLLLILNPAIGYKKSQKAQNGRRLSVMSVSLFW